MNNEEKILNLVESLAIDVKGIKTDLNEVKADMTEVKADMKEVKSSQVNMEKTLSEYRVLFDGYNQLNEKTDRIEETVNDIA